MSTIGEELRRERTRRGLTIKDIEQALHIRSAYLEAIEEDNYKIIPGDVYVKGFIGNYADLMGLERHRMIDRYKSLIGEPLGVPLRRVKPRKLVHHEDVERALELYVTAATSSEDVGSGAISRICYCYLYSCIFRLVIFCVNTV